MTKGVISRAHAKQAQRARNLRNRYGMTLGGYERRMGEQGGKCALASCGRPAERVDHVHAPTGPVRVRGLLCNPCNVAIGLFGESAERLEEAAAYVRRGGG